MIFLAFFGLAAIAIWANFDAKMGEIGNYWLAIPIAISFAIEWMGWLTIYLPIFLGFIGIYWVINKARKIYDKKYAGEMKNKKNPFKFGFADVMVIPFALWIVIENGFVMSIVFAILLGLQLLAYDRLPRLLVPPKDAAGNIRFIPVIFNALLVALIASLLFQPLL